ncbi:hypothetical protein [Xanthomonas phage X1]|nr:hypothetical protein [Xanthomonas phage X1]
MRDIQSEGRIEKAARYKCELLGLDPDEALWLEDGRSKKEKRWMRVAREIENFRLNLQIVSMFLGDEVTDPVS